MILFAGQVEHREQGPGAFQEMDFRAVFGSMTKFTAEIDDPDPMAEMVASAFRGRHVGASRPGGAGPAPLYYAAPAPRKSMDVERVAVAEHCAHAARHRGAGSAYRP